jgi:hypothetical protein
LAVGIEMVGKISTIIFAQREKQLVSERYFTKGP